MTPVGLESAAPRFRVKHSTTEPLRSLGPSQQFFSHVRTDLPELNQYLAADKVSCSRTQHSDCGRWDPSIPSLMVYQLRLWAPNYLSYTLYYFLISKQFKHYFIGVIHSTRRWRIVNSDSSYTVIKCASMPETRSSGFSDQDVPKPASSATETT